MMEADLAGDNLGAVDTSGSSPALRRWLADRGEYVEVRTDYSTVRREHAPELGQDEDHIRVVPQQEARHDFDYCENAHQYPFSASLQRGCENPTLPDHD